MLQRFGSVTVLNGHIHQVLQKVEGNVTFHTAASTAYPQPAPGDGPAPGPLRVVPEQLLSSLGVRQVTFVQKARRAGHRRRPDNLAGAHVGSQRRTTASLGVWLPRADWGTPSMDNPDCQSGWRQTV